MSDVFISYARSTAVQAAQIAEALRALGYGVWRDDELPAHRAYAEVILERLKAAKAVVVLWSADAAKSEWVRSEAEHARMGHKLVQLTVDGAQPPMPFDQIQCADLTDWTGAGDTPGWRKVVGSVAELIAQAAPLPPPSPVPAPRLSICVLPFANMSGEAEQEYFSDGITEDVITDLSKVSVLSVVARNTAFTFKGRPVVVTEVARQVNVSHILEGSVRKAGNRVRITAQLIDGATGNHLWAERYDRDLTDIFALQDEVTEAIVKALKLKLLPEEKQSIERRGTTNAEAYNLFLMARQHLAAGNQGDFRVADAIVDLCSRATQVDPQYAAAWALMAIAQTTLHFVSGKPDDGLAAAERALSLDPQLAEAHAVRARHLFRLGRRDEAAAEIDVALRLDSESYEVNTSAGSLCLRQNRFRDAIGYFEKATELMDSSFGNPGTLIGCYRAIGDGDGARRAAQKTLERAEKALDRDPANGSAMGLVVYALATLGEAEKARDWARRAMLLDPENMGMRYNIACSLNALLNDSEGALELLDPYFAQANGNDLNFAVIDPDLNSLREDPRFQAMIAAAESRLAAEYRPST